MVQLFYAYEKYGLEKLQVLITLSIFVLFWYLRYLWKCLFKGIQDIWLSTFLSFTHFLSLFKHSSHNVHTFWVILTKNGIFWFVFKSIYSTWRIYIWDHDRNLDTDKNQRPSKEKPKASLRDQRPQIALCKS